MSGCKTYNDKMWLDYLQNKLDREELERVQFHLQHCADCRETLKRMRLMAQEINRMSDQERKPSFWKRSVFRVAATVGLLLALSAGSYFLYYTSPETEYPVEMNQPYVYHSIDSAKTEPDSVIIIDNEDTLKYEQK